MSEQQTPKFHPWFHKFLIYFAMWAFPLAGIAYAIRFIHFTVENAARMPAVFITLSALLILVCLYAVKVRFDLAAFRPQAPKELLIVCLAAAALLLIIRFLFYQTGADDLRGIPDALIVALWGFILYRYYHERPYLFKT